ncbi:amidohydrolase family protein [Porphyrobacter sp. SLTP]|uniref:amidohydrolase family protein n=1 Tax=Porphyrobacter sp. SLTP TaxID=2683266 RepID=UPI001411E37D|nr:amidohydrolase family protein [Porphyrobacter sp. SLTP]NBB24391.1 amidohydrolase family protein [Porphyrobacter sp. SLTP]
MVRRIGFWSLGILGVLVLASLSSVWMLLPPEISVPQRSDRMISGVAIWNPGEPLQPNQTIFIKDGRIAEIRPSRPDDDPPICPGCIAMPGLIDAHVHTPPRLALGNQRLFSLLYLKYGVTSVRDLGQTDDSIAGLQADLAEGQIAGPRMYRCGPVLDGENPGWPSALSVFDTAQAVSTVKRLKAEGANCIKTYTGLPKAAFDAAAAEAQRQGLPLVGHTPHAVNLRDVSDFEVQHFTGLPYLRKPPPKGFDYRSQDVSAMTEADITEVIALMKARRISILPTQANQKARLTASDRQRFPPTKGLGHLPEFWEQAWPMIVAHPETDEAIANDLNGIAAELAFVGKARRAGVDVLAGTDVVMPYVVPGESLHLQLAMLTDAFSSTEAALAAATQVNGRHVDRGRIGRIAVGNFADMLILRKDPRSDLAAVKDWSFLMVGGRMYERGQIEAEVKSYDAHFRGAYYESVMNGLVGILASSFSRNESH